MESNSYFDIETLWDQLLSRQPELIRAAYESLASGEKRYVQEHLQRMISETGWHPEQIVSAQAALDAIAPSNTK